MRVHRLWSAALALTFVHGAVRAQEAPGQAMPAARDVAAGAATGTVVSCHETDDRPTLWQRLGFGRKKHDQGAPREAYAKPLGESVYTINRTMVSNGAAARLTLYHFDFIPGTDQLSPRGQEQVARMVPLLTEYPFPLVIERTACAASLDDSRKLVVLNELARVGMPVPAERVVIGIPTATGLNGVESQIQYRRLLQQSLMGGTGTAVTGGVTAGSGGTGFASQPVGAAGLIPGQP